MKKLLFITMTMISATCFSQSIKMSPDGGGGIPPCPDSYCPSINFSMDLLNLHKPRTGCSSGLGICLKFSVSLNCNPCIGKSYIKGDKINLWITSNGQTATLRFPVNVKFEKGFEKADFSTFEIEDKVLAFTFANGVTKLAKGGLYPVSQMGDEYVVNLNFY